MHLKRDHLIKKQLQKNRRECSENLVNPQIMHKLNYNALEQLSMSRIKSREMEFHQIQLFLLCANQNEAASFYQKLKNCLGEIFQDEASKKTFEEKWSHSIKRNVVGLFNRIAKQFIIRESSVCSIFSKLYTDTILKLLIDDKVSRIEEKFLDSLIVQMFRAEESLNILGNSNFQDVLRNAEKCRNSMMDREMPKSLSNCQYLQYSILSLLQLELPHEKFLYSQLLHAPNPKFLLPFQKKTSFAALGSQILLKLNKVDMQGFLYWNYFKFQEREKESYELYNKIRKVAGWQMKIDIILLIIKSKIKNGIEKYMNLINEKIKYYSNRPIDEAGINDLTSYVEICLQICYKKTDPEIAYALQKIDIGQSFQKKFEEQPRLKDTMLKIVQLYLVLLTSCPKKNLKLKFIRKIVAIIYKLLKSYSQQKFTSDLTNLVIEICKLLSEEERTQFLFIIVETINRQWQKQQSNDSSKIIAVDQYVLSFLANFTYEFGFEDYGRPDYKVFKIEFFFIMALNYKQLNYFQSKKKLSLARIDLNLSLTNNSIFLLLSSGKSYYDSFSQHLKSIFGNYGLKNEYEGLLAVIDEIVTFRIQMNKEEKNIEEAGSFYAFLVDFLEQSQRIDPTGALLKCVKTYFQKCIKTYLIETARLKFQDLGKQTSVRLLSLDVSFLCQGSIAANPLISEFCQKALNEYICNYPELAFDTRIVTVLAQCTSLLYRKSTEEYESRAERIKGKYLVSNVLIPTRAKDVTKRLIFIMTSFYQIILQAHCINDNYLRIRSLYLVKQNSKTANITFGWKYLKHVITNFKEDNSFVRNEVLMNNSCAWFINEQFYHRKLREMKPDKILLDKCLLPLHTMQCSSADLKKIFQSVQPQLQIQFLIVPPQNTENQITQILQKIQKKCQNVELLYLRGQYQQIENQQNKIYDIISRIKTIYIQENTSVHIFSRLLEISRKFNNHELFKYVFLKIVPLLYCMVDISKKFLAFGSESLSYIVKDFNTVSRLYFQKNNPHSSQDTFNIKSDYFDSSLEQYQMQQKTDFFKECFSKKMHTTTPASSKRYMVMKLHERRLFCLQKMYKYFIKFLSEHLHVLVAKGIPLLQIAQIFKISFSIDLNLLEFLSLQAVCYCLTSHLQLVNLLKASLEKGENSYDDLFIDDFYFKSLKMGLFHFQKRRTFYQEQLLHKASKTSNIKSLKTKISFFIQICDYLRNDDFHRFRKKRLPKRDEIVFQKHRENQLQNILGYNNPKTRGRLDAFSYNQDVVSLNQEELMNYKNSRISHQQTDIDLSVLRYGLLYLISEQIDRIKAYSFMELHDIENPYSSSGKKKFISHEQINRLHEYFGEKSLLLLYNFIKVFGRRIDDPLRIEQKIMQSITIKPDYGFPEFLELFVQHNKNNINMLKRINYWKPPNVQILFSYLSPEYEKYPYLQLYATKILSRLRSEQILFYLPQIYQALTLKSGQIVYNFLLEYARKSASFAHQLIWISKVQSKIERDPHNKNPRLPGVDENLRKLQLRSMMLTKDIIRQFTREEKKFFKEVDQFYEEITAVSGKLDPKWPFAEKRQKIQQQLSKIFVPKSVYLPTNPFFQVTGLKIQSGTPMQSAAKCPFLLTFKCKKYSGPDKDFEERKLAKSQKNKIEEQFDMEPILEQIIPHHVPINNHPIMGSIFGKSSHRKTIKSEEEEDKSECYDVSDIRIQIQSKREQHYKIKNSTVNSQSHYSAHDVEISCIFKVFDDIRQDSLALQVIQLFMEIFQRHNLELKLFPYKTISNRTGQGLDIGGIIEVVPKTVSRDSIGKTNEQSLYEFFLNNFGPEHNSAFQQARQNFIKSQAAYSIISYILQIKDRHNGNILINKQEGYLVHIDFGFIFDISPANNLRFERADFKLTEEMINIMGGKTDSEPFKLYMSLVIKGFLIARKYHKHVMNIVKLMYHSGLPCFLEPSIENLQSRFVLGMSEMEAAEYMKNIIKKAADHWTTNWYDKIQWIQQRIYH